MDLCAKDNKKGERSNSRVDNPFLRQWGSEPLPGGRKFKFLKKVNPKGLTNFRRGIIQAVQEFVVEDGVKINSGHTRRRLIHNHEKSMLDGNHARFLNNFTIGVICRGRRVGD